MSIEGLCSHRRDDVERKLGVFVRKTKGAGILVNTQALKYNSNKAFLSSAFVSTVHFVSAQRLLSLEPALSTIYSTRHIGSSTTYGL